MRLFPRIGSVGVAVAVSIWSFYTLVELQHFYDTSFHVPPTKRIAREVRELRLPRLYFCPADRGRSKGFQWHSFECTLSYLQEQRTCPGRLQAYRGRTPEEFRADPDGDGFDRHGQRPGECLEFGTHMIGVREEWSAAWNEVSLRAAFHPASTLGFPNALQEVELGYLPVEWEIGKASTTSQRYYYPLLRVPYFFVSTDAYEPGVATRTFLGREIDRGLTTAGKYWFTYGAMQLAVVNATVPEMSFPGTYDAPDDRLAVVHVVITLENFDEFDYVVVSSLFPFLGFLGQIAGMGALLALLVTGPRLRLGSSGRKTAAVADSCASPSGGPEYGGIGHDDDESGDEQQALLGGDRGMRKRDGRQRGSGSEDRPSAQRLLDSEEGLDGL